MLQMMDDTAIRTKVVTWQLMSCGEDGGYADRNASEFKGMAGGAGQTGKANWTIEELQERKERQFERDELTVMSRHR